MSVLKLITTSKYVSSLLPFLSLIISIKLFFSSSSIPWSFTRDSAEWYVNFSKEIFHPGFFLKGAYFTESMLMPAIANTLGAAKSFEAYKVFCAFITISILPIWIMAYQYKTNNSLKSLLLILLLVTCFHYFYDYVLGFPDPLTILLLGLVAIQRDRRVIIFLIVLACLSHFSLTIISIGCLMLLYAFNPDLVKERKQALIKSCAIGIILGKLILMFWMWAFDYHPSSRLQWVLDSGMVVFVQNYEKLGMHFWLMPGIPLLLFFAIACIMLLKRSFLFSLAAIFVLSICYCALFFTVDGYRIFADAITAPYIYLTLVFIDLFFDRYDLT